MKKQTSILNFSLFLDGNVLDHGFDLLARPSVIHLGSVTNICDQEKQDSI